MSIDGGLRALFKKHMPYVDFQPIETGGTGLGIPDTNGCFNGVECWIEFKQTEAWNVTVRPGQVGWAERRLRHGGRVYLATRRWHDGGVRKGDSQDELWLHHGRDTRGVSKFGLQKGPPPIVKFEGGPAKWKWPIIQLVLFSQQ